MRFRLALPVILGAMALSAMAVLAAPSLLVDAGRLGSADRPAVAADAAGAMAFLVGLAGLATASVAGPLARWFPAGLVILGAAWVGIGVYLTVVALTQKPALAPMLIAVHAVFVTAYGFVLPYLAFRDRRRRDQVAPTTAGATR
jgi:hypothetical protein